ncbi:MAG TPA: ATP-binding protein, partial [Terriglobales bacterium]|nr:ATP-binding protein [Terriglobales bacterium]
EAHKILPELRISYCTVDEHRTMQVLCSVASLEMPVVEGKQYNLEHAEHLIKALKSSHMMVVDSTSNEPMMKESYPMLQAAKAEAMLLMPVQHPQKALGFISLSANRPRTWSRFEKELLEDMAEYLAIAIREAHQRQERQEVELQLREAQKMEALGRLVGGVAHDFNNLLTGMMIYSGLLSTALGEASPLLRHVKEIRSAGERGAALVGQLLSMTRKQVLETRLLSLNTVISEMSDMLRRLIGEEIVLETRLAGNLRIARIDPGQLEQAILNLVVNARDAMPSGGRLTIHTENVVVDERWAQRVPGLDEGEYVRLRVSDNGVGMNAEVKSHIFEAFFTTKEQGKGTGLGLATVYGTVHHHAGHISVESAPGVGTTFDLYFPVADGEAEGVQYGSWPQAGRTILLVEDEDMLRVPLKESLKGQGHMVLEAATPERALKISKEHAGVIHLMVTDLVMPGMNGRELAERLAEARKEMRVLYMSGYTDDPRTLALINEGAEFLRKPFSAERLAARVSQLLEQEAVAWPTEMLANKAQEKDRGQKVLSQNRKRDIE